MKKSTTMEMLIKVSTIITEMLNTNNNLLIKVMPQKVKKMKSIITSTDSL